MPVLFTNNATTTLGSSITNTATSLTVASGQGALFPSTASGYFFVALVNSSNQIEFVKVTARSSDTFTIVRAQGGTTARAYTAGDKVELRLISEALQNFVQLDGAQTITGNKTLSGTNTFSGTNSFTGSVDFDSAPTFGGEAELPVASGGTGVGTSTGTGSVVLSDTPTLDTPTLNTPNLTTPTNTTYGKIKALLETVNVTATAPATTTNIDVMTQAVQLHTVDATANFTLNIRGNSSTTLNSIMSNAQSVSVALLVKNGATAYYPTTIQIDGTTVTPLWQNGSAPSSGNANSTDSYSFAIVKTASATFTVLASKIKYA
jgi:hypothetical protein